MSNTGNIARVGILNMHGETEYLDCGTGLSRKEQQIR